MQSQLPPLVYELSHANQHTFAATFGIALDNQPFDMQLPKMFKQALHFITTVAMKQQPYWILRINSPGGAVDASLKPILDLLFAPTCPPFFTVCEGIAASCGFVLFCSGWSSPNGLGASVSPRAQIMCHRVQMCLPPKQWDGADLEKLNNGSKHTQTELAYEINRIWLDNSAHIPLSLVPQALSTNQLRYNPKSLHRQAVWPADFNDYIMMFKGDELALYKSISPTPQRWASKGPPQLLASNQWSWYPSHPLEPVQATSLSDFMETTMQPAEQYVDSGRSAFKDYSGMHRASIVGQRVYTNTTTAWIITRNYETEASTSNEDERELAHTYQPSSVRMHLQEYDPSDRYPYLSWVQRLLRAAREAGTEEIWLDCVEARRLGLSYEASLLHLTVEQRGCTVMPAGISKQTQEQIRQKMDKTAVFSCGCNDARSE